LKVRAVAARYTMEMMLNRKRCRLAFFILALLLAGCGEAVELEGVSTPSSTPTAASQTDVSASEDETNGQAGLNDLSQAFSQGKCEGLEPVVLTAPPADPEDLDYIFPMGLMFGAHVTPVDHQYYYWDDVHASLGQYAVYSPADGYVVEVSYLENDYRLVIEHSCNLYSIFIHLEKLIGALADLEGQVDFNHPQYVRVPVVAGEAIALDGGTNGFDFSLHDAGVVLTGYVTPENYWVEPWKIHTVDPYDYFEAAVRDQLLTKNVRQVEPLGGKIDYDIPGRLIGNWFVQGSNGYQGVIQSEGPIQPDQQIGYWSTHLAIAPDPIDPGAMMASFGSFDGATAQYALAGDYLHPAEVFVDSGVVKYKLVTWGYIHAGDASPWGGLEREMATDIVLMRYENQVMGTVLFQLLEDDLLKMEAFPGQRAAEVEGFTENAVIYTR
jgi:hypothetical protein